MCIFGRYDLNQMQKDEGVNIKRFIFDPLRLAINHY